MLNRRLFTAKHVNRFSQVVLVLLNGVIADGFFYSAHAQCAASDKIYVNPALIPKRHIPSERTMQHILGRGSADADPAVKQLLIQQYMQKDQPIVVPFRARSWCTQPILVFSSIFPDKIARSHATANGQG
jgi:hypothetical protein